ncbi:hypothetical protein [Hyalangium sp.]|uniref:hypothetical protein n=1 Tax=Hyalangium sp. TaxID=2028555 RepID=UPI002D316B21|nr:hypothetical protein [Hyalangium sp.]HYH97952.1 hypothetical protein [Hyalangium sp.]
MLLPLMALHWALAASPASAERRYAPCPVSSPSHAEARKRFEALDAQLSALAERADTAPVVAELRAVLDSSCFQMSREEWTRPREGVHALALKTWWQEGGRAWVASYLELGRPGARTIAMPPEVREVLAKESVPPEHWLAGLLCPTGEAGCSAETRPWRDRLEETFRQAQERQRRQPPLPRPAGWELPDCVALARSKPQRWRYTVWRSCVSGQRPHSWSLPLARLSAPADGWFVLRGRRGHYSFCDDVRAYHLRTGAAYISESCIGLEPTASGEYLRVSWQELSKARKAWVRVGTIDPEKVRELSWALMLGAEASSLHREAQVLTVPEDFPVERREKDSDTVEGGVSGGVSFSGHSGQTRLDWSWFNPSGGVLTGHFTWPDASAPAEAHASKLVREAEATFSQGCPPLPPPLEELGFTRPSSYARPVDKPWELNESSRERIEALRAWSPPASCSGASRSTPP